MVGNCFNIGDPDGKVNDASRSEDIKVPMASLIEGTSILEEEKGSEDKDPKKGVTVEGSSSDVEENTPLQNQTSPAALPDPGGDDAAKPTSVGVSNPPARVAEDDQTSRGFNFVDEKRSEEKDPDKEATVEGSSGDIEKNKPLQIQPSPEALPDPGGDSVAKPASVSIVSPPPRLAEKDEKSRTLGLYSCGKCSKQFPSAQALGGHQNIHRHEEERAKRQRMHGHTPSTSSLAQPTVFYTNCVGFPYILSCEHPQLTLQNANDVTVQRPPLGHPYSMHPNTQYPLSTTRLTLGQSGQPSSMMFNSRQLSIFVRPEMIRVHTGNNGNDDHNNGNLNSMGIVCGQEMGGAILDSSTLNATSRSLVDGLEEEASGSTGFSGIFQGECSASGHNESDGTIDLLSRVGKGNGEM